MLSYGSRREDRILAGNTLSVMADEEGVYATPSKRVGSRLADPNRYSNPVARRIGELILHAPLLPGMHQEI